ncbi:Tigger transposable element-derived protein 6-like [Oopsacas minuta]|uniref:Tigger transposable element-derived protein 6-like n=1 Tax=Oopsacas minuta TaxID=111878 RepID=A0AAV7KKF5_9METZ|nr:Tigger transposable element-derived protein 6-like [Oopsacas minuta]
MDGSDKLPHLIISKSKNPKNKKLPLPVEYTHQKKAWINTQIFNDWLIQVNNKMKRRRRKILILADNFTAHRTPPPMSNVRLQMLCENTTSICQPMDAGIIAALKKMFGYRAAEHKITMLDSGLKPTITLYRALIMLKHS